MKIVCIMGKSAVGKSTVINKLCEDEKYYNIKSYTTRYMRANDPNDINTHVFVTNGFWERNKPYAWAIYYDKVKDYYNWTDKNCFNPNKINLYAIDSQAFKSICDRNENTIGIYLNLDEEERKNRIEKRGGVYREEEHLSSKYLKDFDNVYYVDIDNMSKEQVKEKIKKIIEESDLE